MSDGTRCLPKVRVQRAPHHVKGPSGNWNGDPVSGNHLRLEGEDFAAVGIHECLHPMNVVEIAEIGVLSVYAEYVVAKGLDACEIFKAAPGRSRNGLSIRK